MDLCRYHETTIQQPARPAVDQFLYLQTCSQLASASPDLQKICSCITRPVADQSTSNNPSRTIIDTLRPRWLYKCQHRSSGLHNQSVHFFDRLQIPDHVATRSTKIISFKTAESPLVLTAPIFDITETTQTLYSYINPILTQTFRLRFVQ